MSKDSDNGDHSAVRVAAAATAGWGATRREKVMPLPGDDLVPSPVVQTTHAVTIHAPPGQVWPWLVQAGQGRAGFYSDSQLWDRCVDWYYRLLSRQQRGEGGIGYHVAADDRIVAAWQNPRVGDIIADGPPGTARYVVRQAEPGKTFVLFTDTHLRYLLPARLRGNPRLGISGELSASYLLTEPEPATTRLIRRMRLRCGPWPFRAYVVPVVLIWGEAITARNFLRGVKRRAEAGTNSSRPGVAGPGRCRSMTADHAPASSGRSRAAPGAGNGPGDRGLLPLPRAIALRCAGGTTGMGRGCGQ